MNEHDALFAQFATLGASLVLLFGIALLWRRSLRAYTKAFQWQSLVLSGMFVLVGYFGHDPQLYLMAVFFFVLKVLVIPWYLDRLQQRVGGERESQPYVNIATSLIASGVLVLLAYIITRPVVRVSALPTRGGLPLAVGLIFVGLFVIITRRKALTQVVGFLVLENGLAMLAVLGTYGIPLIIELGVFLDVLMGFLVMQVFVYHIHGTFESIDVDQLDELKH
jgi:hydrogenase-4 component E